jgi:hypothetical protein
MSHASPCPLVRRGVAALMAANPYTTRGSVLKRVALGGLPSAAGMAASSLAGSDAITLDGHGFETDDPVTARAAEGGNLSAPLAEGTTYYAIRVDHSTFKLASTVGGAAIDLTTNALDMFVMRDPDFDYWIGVYSRWADTSFPGHVVPFAAPVPSIVESIVADLVAKRMFNVGGHASVTLDQMETQSAAQLARFASGMPVREASATAPTNLAVTSNLGELADARGWAPCGSGYLP